MRKLLSQDRSGPWIPYAYIFVKRRLCGTESKAFERSKNITSVVKPLFVFQLKAEVKKRYFLISFFSPINFTYCKVDNYAFDYQIAIYFEVG